MRYGTLKRMKGRYIKMDKTPKVHKLTSERYKQYEEELNYLKTVREKEVAEAIAVARSYGDLSENSEYDEAKNEQGKLYSHIAEIEDILAHAVFIDEEGATEKVDVGCTVTVEVAGKERSYTIVGSNDADPRQGKISDESPLGKALLGIAAGQTVEYETPSGKMAEAKLINISR